MVVKTKDLMKMYKRLDKSGGILQTMQRFLNWKYDEKAAIDGVTLTIEQGEMVGIAGATGAGKTTLVKLLGGLSEPTSGCLEYIEDEEGEAIEQSQEVVCILGNESELDYEGTTEDAMIDYKLDYDVNDAEYQEKKKQIMELLECEEFVRTPLSDLPTKERLLMELAVSLFQIPK